MWSGKEGEGWNIRKKVGYFRKNLTGKVERVERGRDDERIWFLREMICLRSFSLETTVSR